MGKEVDLTKSWRHYNPTPQLNGLDLRGKDLIVTIDHFKEEKVSAEPKEKLVAYFKEQIIEGDQKGMICGATVSRTLTKLAGGRDDVGSWIGMKIQIFPTIDRDKDVVRVRPYAPKVEEKETLSPSHPKWHDAIKAVAEGRTTLEKVCTRYIVSDDSAKLISIEAEEIQRERAQNA